MEYAVKTPKDLEAFQWLMEHRRLEPSNLTDYPARAQHWAWHGGVPCLGLPRSPLPAFVTE